MCHDEIINRITLLTFAIFCSTLQRQIANSIFIFSMNIAKAFAVLHNTK